MRKRFVITPQDLKKITQRPDGSFELQGGPIDPVYGTQEKLVVANLTPSTFRTPDERGKLYNFEASQDYWKYYSARQVARQHVMRRIQDAIRLGSSTSLNAEVQRTLNSINSKFPASQWELEAGVNVTDFDSYGTQVPVVAKNRTTGEVHLIHIETGTQKKFQSDLYLSAQKHMFQQTYPGVKVAGTWTLKTGDTYKSGQGWLKGEDKSQETLNRILYPGIIKGTMHKINLDRVERRQLAKLDNSVLNKLPKYTGGTPKNPVSVVDIETGAHGEVLSIAGVKVAQNSNGTWGVVDTFQRFYVPRDTKSGSFLVTQAVHGYTGGTLLSLRAQQAKQGLKYERHYGRQSFNDLNNFVRGSVMVGHNINRSDIPKLTTQAGIKSSFDVRGTIDTLTAANNSEVMPYGHRKLGDMYRWSTGQTPAQSGIRAHDPLADVVMNTVVFDKMMSMNGDTGDAIRRIVNGGENLTLATRDSVTGSQLIQTGAVGGEELIQNYVYPRIQAGRGRKRTADTMSIGAQIRSKNMTQAELDDLMGVSHGNDVFTFNDSGQKVLKDGFHTEDVGAVMGGGLGGLDAYSDSITAAADTMAHAMDRMSNMAATLKDASNTYNTASLLNRKSGYGARFRETRGMTDPEAIEYLSEVTGIGEGSPAMTDLMGTRDLFLKAQDKARDDSMSLGFRNRIKDFSNKVRYSDKLNDEQRADLLSQAKATRTIEGADALRDSLTDLNHQFDEATKGAEMMERGLKAFSKLTDTPWYNGERIVKQVNSDFDRYQSSAKGFMPSILRSPLKHMIGAVQDANQQWWDRGFSLKYQGANAAHAVFNAVGDVVGDTIDKRAGAAIKFINNIPTIGSQIKGRIAENKLKQVGNDISMVLNMFSTGVQLALIPLKLFSGALGLASNLFKKLLGLMHGGISLMGNLGTPITGLSNVRYPQYQGLQAMDSLVGLQSGSINSSIENFGLQQANLYTRGIADDNRIVAAAMAGVFDLAYGNQADTEESYTQMINRLVAKYSNSDAMGQKRLMSLIKDIDPSAMNIVQVMSDLGITDFRKYQNPSGRGVYWNPISDKERQRFRWTNYEYQSAQTAWGNAKMRVGDWLWNGFGKNMQNGFTMSMDMLASGNIKGAADQFVSTIAETWKRLIAMIKQSGLVEQIGSWLGEQWVKLVDWLGSLNLSFDGVARPIKGLLDQIINWAIDRLDYLVEYLKTFQFDPTKLLSDPAHAFSIGWDGGKSAKEVFADYRQGASYANQQIGFRTDFSGIPEYRRGAFAAAMGKAQQMYENGERFEDIIAYLGRSGAIQEGDYIATKTRHIDYGGYKEDSAQNLTFDQLMGALAETSIFKNEKRRQGMGVIYYGDKRTWDSQSSKELMGRFLDQAYDGAGRTVQATKDSINFRSALENLNVNITAEDKDKPGSKTIIGSLRGGAVIRGANVFETNGQRYMFSISAGGN